MWGVVERRNRAESTWVIADSAVAVSVRVAGPTSPGAPSHGLLAHTGFSAGALLVVALLLVVAGIAVLRSSRTQGDQR